jgi:nicotinate phosphoribosyltransferase
MATSSDAPVLDTAYKLAEYGGHPKLKLSESKTTLPGRKQVFRNAAGDTIGLHDEPVSGQPLLVRVMAGGKRLHPPESLQTCRERCRAEVATLPESHLKLTKADVPYRVDISPGLMRLKSQVSAK